MASALLDTGGLPPGGLPTKPSAGLELSFSLDDPAFGSDHFRMYDFKVKRCPRARPHDWTACPFAHPGEKAKRRDPRRYRYSGTACPDFRKTGVCRRGDACPYSHGVFECWLHPSRYRTQMCTDGPSCRRRVCFFAHYEHELRRAEEYPPLLNQQLHAGLVADARALQQQQLAQALSGILGNSVPQMAGGPPSSLEPLMSMQLLKTLSQGTPSALMDSNPATPTGIAGLSPNSAAAGGLLHDNSKLLMQLQMMQQQQHVAGASAAAAAALGSLAGTVSDASQHSAHSGHSGSSPGGSPRYMTCTGEMFTPGGVVDASRQGSPPVHGGADEASQLARLIQQQHHQQQAQQAQQAAAQAAAAAGGIDPALLAALQNLGLGAAGSMQEGLDVASLSLGLSRRSVDNGALSRQFPPTGASSSDNYLAAAAAALASGTAVGGLDHSNSHGAQTGGVLSPSSMGGGSLPNHSYMQAAAALARSSGGMSAGQLSSPPAIEDNPTLSLDHILAELPRSASQVHLPTH